MAVAQPAEKRVLRRHWFNDAFYLVLNAIPITLGFAAPVGVMMVGARVVPGSVGKTIRTLPVWAQAIGAIVVADVGF
jgi:hypothetical protein